MSVNAFAGLESGFVSLCSGQVKRIQDEKLTRENATRALLGETQDSMVHVSLPASETSVGEFLFAVKIFVKGVLLHEMVHSLLQCLKSLIYRV